METFDFMLILPLVMLQLILIIITLLDVAKRDVSTLQGENKLIWVLVILFINVIGPIMYLVIGRKKG
ncbi:PLD nuclease N-terminal domain-containing protein [Peribacillus asahii]|uniref:PLD nuclease N-terminal domain-containing protein n=1 Tax=Peribacillus asahii TaxID=228899 RepID=UPI00207A6D21|nr:PLD nuclease N-terminal domain-containing protein [Peribacillus asahii]USK70999.1 PLD nuclease N-terminal domain-containing protein [Peribacillus asahii]